MFVSLSSSIKGVSLIDYQGLWESYQTEFKLAANYKLMEFGNTVEMAQELAELVLKGEKTRLQRF